MVSAGANQDDAVDDVGRLSVRSWGWRRRRLGGWLQWHCGHCTAAARAADGTVVQAAASQDPVAVDGASRAASRGERSTYGTCSWWSSSTGAFNRGRPHDLAMSGISVTVYRRDPTWLVEGRCPISRGATTSTITGPGSPEVHWYPAIALIDPTGAEQTRRSSPCSPS